MREGKSLSDLTELKEVKERLEEDPFLFLEVFEKAHEGMCLFGASGRLYFLNDSYASLLGYTKEELMDPSFCWDALIFPEDLGLVHNNVSEVEKTGQPRHYEARFLKKDGSVIRVMVSESKLEGRMGERPEEIMLETIYDITELRKTQRQLEKTVANQQRAIEEATDRIEHECRYWREVFEASQSGMAVFDPDGRVWDVNEALASMLGYTKEEVLSPDFSWARMIVKEELSMATTHLQELLKTGVSQSLEWTFIHKDGHKVPTVISYTKLTKRPDWSSERMVANITDLTGIKAQQDYVNDLLKLLPIGMFTFDFETARIYSANTLFQELLGYSQEELAQKTAITILPEAIHEEAKERIQRTFQAGERSWVRWPMLRKDGSKLSVMISDGKVFDPCLQKDIMAVFVVDISESEQAKARMELLLKLSPVAVCEWRPGGELLSINEQFARMVGYSIEEVYAMGWKNLTAPEYQGDPDRLHEENTLRGTDKTYRKEYIHKDGHRVPIYLVTEPIFDDTGRLESYISFIQDLSEILEKERFLDSVLNTVPDGVVIGDASGKLHMVNRGYSLIVGKSVEELLAVGWEAMTNTEDIDRTKDVLRSIEKGESEEETIEKRYTMADGTQRTTRNIYKPIQYKGRQAALCCATDITKIKQAQEKLQELVEAQQRTIKELSTPVIPVWSRVIMAPLLGSFDSMRMHDLSERLLQEVASQKPRAVLLDLSGLAYVDTQVISEVVKLIASVRILGTRTVLSGIGPHVAQSLVRLGANLEGIPTYATLEQALRSVAGGKNR